MESSKELRLFAEESFEPYRKTLDFVKDNKEFYDLLFNNTERYLWNFDRLKSVMFYGEVQSGKTNNLIYMVNTLLELGKIDCVVYLTGKINAINDQNYNRFLDAFTTLNASTAVIKPKNKRINADDIIRASDEGKKIIMSTIKVPDKLQYLNKLLNTIEMRDKKVLFIDDEADEASISVSNYKKISSLLGENRWYLAITGSPYLNFYKNLIKFDDFIVLTSHKNYAGLKVFHENNEQVKLLECDNVNITDEDTIRPLLTFIKTIAKNNLTQAEFLINTSSYSIETRSKQKTHYDLRDMIIDNLQHLKNIEAHDLKENYYKKETDECVQKIFNLIQKCISRDSIIISNADRKDLDEHIIERQDRQNYKIIIGGNLLSRGLTFSNLVTELFLNAGKKISPGTLIQRARWFGNRLNKMDHMNIYMNSHIDEAFKELLRLDVITREYDIEYSFKKIFDNENFKRLELKND